MSLPRVIIYTDGSCLGNPGPGGYGVVLLSADRKRRRELSGFEVNTTNNRMELLGAIAGLRALKTRCRVQVRSDSRYLVDLGNGVTRGKTNRDLIQQLRAFCTTHDVLFVWLKGHNGHPENERCDELAKAAAEDVYESRPLDEEDFVSVEPRTHEAA